MKFSEIVKQASELLRVSGRISYRALKVEFDLTDDLLDILKDELIDARRVAVDEGHKVLVWTGDGGATAAPPPQPLPSQPHAQSPATYTPQHLAERIRAEQ